MCTTTTSVFNKKKNVDMRSIKTNRFTLHFCKIEYIYCYSLIALKQNQNTINNYKTI